MTELPDFSFLQYGCHELANHARLKAYTEWAKSAGAWEDARCCVDMPSACWCESDGVPADYSDPVTDAACWYDPAIPESVDYLGMYVTKVTGLRDSAYSRTATDNVGEGVTLGRSHSGSRMFTIEALLVATSCCGMDYGIEYVRRTLEQGGCGVGSCLSGCGDLGSCGLTCLTARVCCPEGEEGEDTGLRQWVNVGLVDGLKVIDEEGGACRCCMTRVTFVVQAEVARSFGCEPTVCLEKNADLENTAVRCFDWASCGPADDAESACVDDPGCDPAACALPTPPTRVSYCWCEPLGVSVDCCCPGDLANHRDETYRIVLDAGKDPGNAAFAQYGLRNTRILFYPADPRRDCPSDDEVSAGDWTLDDACAALEIPYLKAGAQLVIDGRTQRITVECDNQCFPGWQSVYGVGGSSPFPLLASCNGIFVCVEWDLNATQFVDDAGAGAVPSRVKIERYRAYG